MNIMKKQTTLLLLLLLATLTAWASQPTLTTTAIIAEDGESKETAIVLVEGQNDIPSLKMGDPVRWYKTTAKGMKRTKVLFTGYPVMTAYLGDDMDKSLGFNNPVDYINDDEDQDIYICLESTNEEDLVATVSYGEPVADLTRFGSLTYSIEKNDDVPAGSSIAVTFPERIGGADSDPVTLTFYIFSVKGGSIDGAPVNLGGNTSAEGTLSEGVQVAIDGLNIGKKYRLSVQSLSSGSHFAPGPDEQALTPAYIDFYFTESSGIESIDSPKASEATYYNLAGQRILSPHMGEKGSRKSIIIRNGKKQIK